MKLGRFELDYIYNEDCYKSLKCVPDKSIDLVYIDIPYLYKNGCGGKSTLAERIAKKNLELKNIINGIDFSILDELCRVMKRINIYIWCSKMQINDIMNYFINKGCNFEILVWCKTNPTPTTNNVWLPDIEYCLFFKEKGVKLNDGYDLKHKYYISGANVEDKEKYKHPTIKPLELVKKHILHSTQPNDIVLDCFCGSGTTCVACKELGRRFIGFEIDKEYFNIAIDRLNGITAQERKILELGQMSLFD